jgi:hypothetical protein
VRFYPTTNYGNIQFTAICHTAGGWLWLGAGSNIYRFDGINFAPVKGPKEAENSSVSAIFEYEGLLYTGFQNGKIATIRPAGATIPVPSGDVETDLGNAPSMVLWSPEEACPQHRLPASAPTATEDCGFQPMVKVYMSGNKTGCSILTGATMVWVATMYMPLPVPPTAVYGLLPMRESAFVPCRHLG